MSMLAIFRADASQEFGSGHAVRCSALAHELISLGWRVVFTHYHDLLPCLPFLSSIEPEYVSLQHPDFRGAEELIDRFPGGCDLLVVDHYALGQAFEKACEAWAGKILVIDDLVDRPHFCHALLNASSVTPEDYREKASESCLYLLGPEYALLRPEFARLRTRALDERFSRERVGRIMINFGSMDGRNVTPMALRAAALLGPDIEVDVLIGSGAPGLQQVRSEVGASGVQVALHTDTPRVAELMLAADLCIGASGSASLERCCLGLPSIAVETVDNQRRMAESLKATGAALVVDLPLKALTVDSFRHALSSILPWDCRRPMAEAAFNLCDGMGVNRVSMSLLPERSYKGLPVILRPAALEDASLMLEWQQDPRSRRYFRNPSPPDELEHIDWLRGRLRDPNTLLNLIFCGDQPVGSLRLDRRPNANDWEISVLVSPDQWGQGIAKAALVAARRLMPEARFFAQVHPENVASKALFTGAGFVAGGDHWYFDHPRQMIL